MSTRTLDATSVVDHSPARVSTAIALVVALLGAVSLAVSVPAVAVGALGVAILGAGLFRGSRAAISLGAAGLFGGVLLAGLAGPPPELLLFATAAAVVSWDIAEFAVGLGREMGRAAETTRVELVHAGVSALVALVAAAGGALVFRLSGGGPSLVAIALLCGAVVLVVALRP